MVDAKLDRRSFLRKSAFVGGATAGVLAAPAVLAQAPKVVKMQTSWPASDIWMDFARQYTTRIEEMSGGRLTIDLLPAGAVVAAAGAGGDTKCRPRARLSLPRAHHTRNACSVATASAAGG